MMHVKVLLTQFVLQCNSFTPIVCRPHHKYCMQAGTSHSQDAHTLCAYACTCRWFMCWSMHLNMPLVLSHTNSHTLTAKVLQPANLSSAAHLEPVFMCIRVMYMHGTVQVSLFSVEPKDT